MLTQTPHPALTFRLCSSCKTLYSLDTRLVNNPIPHPNPHKTLHTRRSPLHSFRAASHSAGVCDACFMLYTRNTLNNTASFQVSKALATGHIASNKAQSSTESSLLLFPLLLHLLSSPVLRPATVSDGLIADLAAYLAASAHTSVQNLAGISEFQVASLCRVTIMKQAAMLSLTRHPTGCTVETPQYVHSLKGSLYVPKLL